MLVNLIFLIILCGLTIMTIFCKFKISKLKGIILKKTHKILKHNLKDVLRIRIVQRKKAYWQFVKPICFRRVLVVIYHNHNHGCNLSRSSLILRIIKLKCTSQNRNRNCWLKVTKLWLCNSQCRYCIHHYSCY